MILNGSYGEYRYAESPYYLNVMLSVVMQNVVMQSVVMQNVVMLSVVMQSIQPCVCLAL